MGLSRRRREEGFGPQPVDRLGRSLQNLIGFLSTGTVMQVIVDDSRESRGADPSAVNARVQVIYRQDHTLG